jgi:hypothetical protein
VPTCYYDGDFQLADDLDAVIAANRAGDYDQLAAYVSRYPRSLRLNPTRSSLQIFNCQAAVVGSLSIEHFATLSRALEQGTSSSNP